MTGRHFSDPWLVTHQPLEQKASFVALLKQQPRPSRPSAGGYYKSASVKNGMRFFHFGGV